MSYFVQKKRLICTIRYFFLKLLRFNVLLTTMHQPEFDLP